MRPQDDPHKTYAIRSPIRTRPATCEEMDCPAWRDGWTITVPLIDMEFFKAVCAGRVDGIKREPIEVTGLFEMNKDVREFMFNPGNSCFDVRNPLAEKPHVKVLPAPEFYFVGHGSTGNQFRIKNARQHANGEDWQEDMQEHLARVKQDEERGNRNG